jgi:glycosyltransferase involved in cell wall biosynthesis
MSTPVRVIRIIARLNVGGPARHVTILDRGLGARGYDTLLVYGPSGPDEGSLERLAEALPTYPIQDLGRRIRPTSDLRAFVRLVRLMFARQPQVIHTHTAKAGALGRVAALLYNSTRRKQHRAVVVHTFHGHVLEGYFGRTGSWLTRVAERALGLITDCVIAISESQHADLVGRFRVSSSEKTVVVPLGLELDNLLGMTAGQPSLRPELGLASDAIVIGYVGRLVPIKDLPLLVHAFSLVAAVDDRVHLLIAGDGPARAELTALCGALGITARCHLIGWCDDLTRLYATCDLVALTSITEGTPVALIEAMAAGLPVVALRVGGVPDVIEDGVTGLLVSDRDPAVFARALRTLIEDGPSRRKLAQQARERARDRYSSTRLISEIDQLYRDHIGRSRTRIERG